MNFSQYSLLNILHISTDKDISTYNDGIYVPSKRISIQTSPCKENYVIYPSSNVIKELSNLLDDGFLKEISVPIGFAFFPIIQVNKLTGDISSFDFTYYEDNKEIKKLDSIKLFENQTVQIVYENRSPMTSITRYIANFLNQYIKSKNIVKFIIFVNQTEDSLYWNKKQGIVNIRFFNITR